MLSAPTGPLLSRQTDRIRQQVSYVLSMSNLSFPVLNSSNWKLSRTPQWKTQAATSSSGVHTRNPLQTSPIWKWTLKNGILRAADTVGDLQTIQNLFLQMYGRWDYFMWSDPEGSSLIDPTIALG